MFVHVRFVPAWVHVLMHVSVLELAPRATSHVNAECVLLLVLLLVLHVTLVLVLLIEPVTALHWRFSVCSCTSAVLLQCHAV